MKLSSLIKFSSKSQFPVVAGVVLVFGLFAIVMLTQQRQDVRSRASGTGGTGNCSTVNPSSGEDLVSDNCTIASGFNGSVIGNYNVIMGGVGGPVGNIIGNNNTIQGGVNGCIKGNNNTIYGGVNGGVEGTGNIIYGAFGTGPCPKPTVQPTQPPTVPPTRPFGTCKDGIDNNQNELIDGGDPVCHTDGNQDNPGSYDPYKNEGPFTPTVTVRPTITTGPTVTVPPTLPPTTGPTVTVPPGNTSVKLNLLLHGIGQGGDSANPNSGGNPNPRRTQRPVVVQVFNSQNALVLTKDGTVNYNQTGGNFTGQVDLGSGVASGVYTVKVKTTQFLNTLVPGIQNLTQGQANQLPSTAMVNGDIDGNNVLNILDYNILMGCYSDFLPAQSCTEANKPLSDLDDDGDVNQFDYNLFLREITNREGQ